MDFIHDHVGLGTKVCIAWDFPDLAYDNAVHDIVGNLEVPQMCGASPRDRRYLRLGPAATVRYGSLNVSMSVPLSSS